MFKVGIAETRPRHKCGAQNAKLKILQRCHG